MSTSSVRQSEDEEEEKREDEGEAELETEVPLERNVKDKEIAVVTLTPLKLLSEIAENQQRDSMDDERARSSEGEADKPIKLYKSSRLKGYITLVLASFINYQAAEDSSDVQVAKVTVVPSTPEQRRYAMAVAVVSLVLSIFCILTHLDRLTPMEKIWIIFFKNGSKYEGLMLVVWSIWWMVATGIETSVSGIAGDGKGQYSLYYSTWVCCLTSVWCLERWWVAMGWVSTGVRGVSPFRTHSVESGRQMLTQCVSCLRSDRRASSHLFPAGPIGHPLGSASCF